MFDVPGLKERYAKLVVWDGLWVNYWTETGSKQDGAAAAKTDNEMDVREQRERENDIALLETGMAGPSETQNTLLPGSRVSLGTDAQKADAKATKKAEKALKKQHETALKAKKCVSPSRHFIVLPTGLGRRLGGSGKWECVTIGGVHDEVAAHCGIFIRSQNRDYDGFVERVGKKVLAWCETV